MEEVNSSEPPYYIKICTNTKIEEKKLFDFLQIKENDIVFTYIHNSILSNEEYRFKIDKKEIALKILSVYKSQTTIFGIEYKLFYEPKDNEYSKDKYDPEIVKYGKGGKYKKELENLERKRIQVQ